MGVILPGRNNKDLTKINQALEQMAQGRLNCSGTFTLAASATTTVVKSPTVSPSTVIVFSPMTSDAASVVATTYILAANISTGSFTVTHASAGSVDRTFGYIAIG